MNFKSKRLNCIAPYSIPKQSEKHMRMDQNENYLYSHEKLVIESKLIRKYPDIAPLKEAVAKTWGIKEENLMFFNGASEAIMCSSLSFINPGDTAITIEPEFALIPHYLKLAGASVVGVQLTKDYKFDLKEIENELELKRRVFFASVPNNPSGALLKVDLIEGWCRRYISTLFIIDETYAAFAGTSLLLRASRHPNLIVIRSFSKDSALAGLRLGAAVGHKELLESMATVRTPYSVNVAAVKAALRVMDERERFAEQLNQTKHWLDKLSLESEKAGFTVLRGNCNFFLVMDDNAEGFSSFCRERGVILRVLNKSLLRVSPSDKEGNANYLKCLIEWRKI